MKFYGHGLIWDKERNKVLCKFINGELITEDEGIIEKLKRLNYSFNEIYNEQVTKNENSDLDNDNKFNDVDYSKLSYQELKKIAKEKGIKLEKSMKQAEILEVLVKVGE